MFLTEAMVEGKLDIKDFEYEKNRLEIEIQNVNNEIFRKINADQN